MAHRWSFTCHLMNARLQALTYVGVIILMTLIVALVGENTWRQLRQLHRNFSRVQMDDIYLSEYVEATVFDLNELIVRIRLYHKPADKAAFEDMSRDLVRWIRAQTDTLTTADQRGMMKQMGVAFERYATECKPLMDGPKATDEVSAKTLLETLDNNASPILDLCEKLKASERAEQTQFLTGSMEALAWIQKLLIFVFVGLAVLVATGIASIYTGVVGPLRVELTRSRALASRNEKMASLGTLAAGVAHEIRNPLTAINVRLHTLKKNLPPDSSEQEDALVIGSEIQRLDGIVQQFLQFARPAEPKLLTVSVDSLFAKIQSLFGAQFEKRGIRLLVECKPGIWVRVDPYQIEQVLINLVRNAAESIVRDGTITLRANTGNKPLMNAAEPAINIEVSDTGTGITPEVQKRMFDPFFTTKEQGTGLGLVIASRIIEKHNGTLECRSEPNKGSTFTISLPNTNTGQDT